MNKPKILVVGAGTAQMPLLLQIAERHGFALKLVDKLPEPETIKIETLKIPKLAPTQDNRHQNRHERRAQDKFWRKSRKQR